MDVEPPAVQAPKTAVELFEKLGQEAGTSPHNLDAIASYFGVDHFGIHVLKVVHGKTTMNSLRDNSLDYETIHLIKKYLPSIFPSLGISRIDLERMKPDGYYEIAPSADLHGANLSNRDLANSDLSNANLYEANLTGADLRHSRLKSANLEKADLSKSNLNSTDLGRAFLLNSNLSGADLSSSDMQESKLRFANLRKAILRDADLSGADILKADLSGADLSGANLSKADLTGSNLEGAILCRVDLSGSNLSDCNLMDADLSGSKLENTDFSNARMPETFSEDMQKPAKLAYSLFNANLGMTQRRFWKIPSFSSALDRSPHDKSRMDILGDNYLTHDMLPVVIAGIDFDFDLRFLEKKLIYMQGTYPNRHFKRIETLLIERYGEGYWVIRKEDCSVRTGYRVWDFDHGVLFIKGHIMTNRQTPREQKMINDRHVQATLATYDSFFHDAANSSSTAGDTLKKLEDFAFQFEHIPTLHRNFKEIANKVKSVIEEDPAKGI
jgi:uncharacterized protein YjbI with pentapeptide repeats